MKRSRRCKGSNSEQRDCVTLGEQQDLEMVWLNFEVFKCHREYNLNLKAHSLSS